MGYRRVELRRPACAIVPKDKDQHFVAKGRNVKGGNKKEDFAVVELLKTCGYNKDLHTGSKLHAEIHKKGLLERNPYVSSTLITMYTKCGAIGKAEWVLNQLPDQGVIPWNALIAGYTHHGKNLEALNCFERMQRKGVCPDAITFTCVLKACGNIGDADKGMQIHDEIKCRDLLRKDIMLGTALVDMYAKCGILIKAQEVFDQLPARNVVSWTSLIAGYAQHGKGHQALNCFERMQREGISPNAITFIAVLKACGSVGSIAMGKQIHDEIAQRCLLANDSTLGNALIDMYSKCGMIAKAEELLYELPIRDVVSWSTLIAGFVQQENGDKALTCFEQMQREGISPNEVTFISVLKACGIAKAIEKGKQVHDEIVVRGLLKKDVVLATALVDMYAKCGMFQKAQQVLYECPNRDVISWNAIIGGYAQQGQGREALSCFEIMQREGFSPNIITMISLLKACGSIKAIGKGILIHNEIATIGFLQNEIAAGNALADMYVKCDHISKAREVLDKLPYRDTISWNTLIVGYTQRGQDYEALKCFEQMQKEHVSLDEVTFTCVLKSCSNMGAIDKGKQIHEQIATNGSLKKSIELGNALLDMYAKCGALSKAHEVLLHELPSPDVISWNILISGYSQQGQGLEALKCFKQMQAEGVYPDSATISSVLSACSLSGQIQEAETYFQNMSSKYGITPNIEHYTCMVHAFAYTGHFEKAICLINHMPCSEYPSVWLAMLSACRKWGYVKFGRLAFDNAMRVDGTNALQYTLIAEIYAAAGMEEEEQSIEAMKLKNAPNNCERLY